MQELSGFPYFEAEFDTQGTLNPPGQATRIIAAVQAEALTDFVVISHGWNNDITDARELYRAIFSSVRAVLSHAPLPRDRRIGILGVLWPSKKFTDRELISGGGSASVTEGIEDTGDVSTTYLEAEIDRLKEVASPDAPDLEEAKLLLDQLEDDPAARKRFVELVRASMDPPSPSSSSSGQDTEASADALDNDSEKLFDDLRSPLMERPHDIDLGGAAGLGEASPEGVAVSIGSIFSTAKAAAERLLNFATYYQMKERAGRIGSTGLADLLRAIRRHHPRLVIHLVGHSFGARLVTSAVDHCGKDVQPASLVLLQAAFSHNGFAPKFDADGSHYTGVFRPVIESHKVAGPIVITHTVNDRAVGIAYAVASRLARQAATGLGDENDLYGGLGRNGAVRMPEAELGGRSLELLSPGGQYNFAAGKIFNLKSDRFIDGHAGIANEAVAYVMLKAITASVGNS